MSAQSEADFLTAEIARLHQRLAAIMAPAPAPPVAPKKRVPIAFPGVNIASAEFASDKLPGVMGQTYLYPDDWVITPWAAKGIKLIRIPFLIERVQPQNHGEFSAPDIAALDRIIATAAGAGLTVVLDAHNYGQRAGAKMDVGDAPNFWWRMATRYRNAPHVMFGIMNEPSAWSPVDWQVTLRKCVAGIRVTGAKQTIMAPGAGWNGAHDFVTGGNAAAFDGFTDPNFMVEVHQYLDGDNSGSHLQEYVAGKGATVLADVTTWARTKGFRLFLGEFGFAMPAGQIEATAMLQFMTDNSDVWAAYGVWAAGQWWGDYAFGVEPSTAEKPQLAVLQNFMG